MNSATHTPGPKSAWVLAARPRTLVAGVAPVIVGTAAAGRFIAWRFVVALVVGIAMQIGVNYANDYFDGVKGVDAPDRIGPPRAVASGLIAPGTMKAGSFAAFAVACGAGSVLALLVQPWLLLAGAASVLAALGYSGGPKPYGSIGLGEVFVFLFFGLVATTGSYYVQAEQLTGLGVAVAFPVGLVAVALLVVNNLRDIETDRRGGKVTLAVRLGRARTRLFYSTCLALALVAVPVVALLDESAWSLLALIPGLPLAFEAHRLVHEASEPRALIAGLGATARVQAALALVLAGGLWIS